MILVGSKLKVIDNTGAREVKCIGLLNVGKRRYALAGDIIKVTVRSVRGDKKIDKGTVCKAVVVSVKKGKNRNSGEKVVFNENAVVLIKNDNLPLGTRVLGAVMAELRQRDLMKIISLSKVTI